MVSTLVVAILNRPRSRMTAGGPDTLSGRARWLTCQSRHLLRILRVSVSWKGTIPDSGLVVSNHLG